MNAVQHLPPLPNGPSPYRPQNLGPLAAYERDDRQRNMGYSDSGHSSPMSPTGGSDFSFTRYQTNNDPYQSPGMQLQPPPSRGNPGNSYGHGGSNSNNSSPTTMGFGGGDGNGGLVSLANSGSTNSMVSQRSSGRSSSPRDSVILEHYAALKKYLARLLANDSADELNQRQHKAREKLIRLSRTQFSELSTDVYDEIMRRQSTQKNEQFLGPKENFHPKRNQARQKLATLPPGRFKELAADVLYEIERRYPVTLETPPVDDRRTSNSSYNSQRNSDNPPFPTNGGSSFPPSTSRDRFPSNNSSGNITTIPEEPNEPSSETVAKSGMPTSIIPNKSMMVEDGSEEEDEEPTPKQQLTQPNRTLSNPKSPVAKTFMANTIVPNTSTMVEESPSDIEDDNLRADEDKNKTTSIAPSILSTSKSLSPPVFKSNAFANAGRQRSISPPPKLSPSKSINQIEEEHARRDEEMQDKIVQYEDKIEALKERIAELQHALKDSEESLRTERSKPPPVAPVVPASPTKDRRIKDLQDENDRLKDELREQQEVTIDVRREAMELLEEMKVLTSQHDVYLETQSSSSREMARLQSEIREWKSRYAQLKVQSRSIAATNGSHPSTPIRVDIKSRLVSEESGLIEMSSIQRFQSSIDELLVAARQRDTESEMMDNMTEVVKATRAITDDLKVGGRAGIEDEPRVKRLTARLSATANNLITATKNHVSSQGLSPVSLVDAAASHLANTVIELVKLVKLRPSNTASMRTDDETHSDRSHYSEIATPLTSPLAPNSPTSQQKPGPTPPKNIPGPLPLGSRSNLAPRTREEMYSPRSPESPRSFDSRRSSSRHQMSNKDDEELRLYLDDQTHAIVESIQSMLARIRNPKLDSIEDFRGQIEEIVSIVEKIVDHTDRQVAKVDRLAGDSRLLSVLRSMEDCCSAMKNVAKTSGSEDGFKKRLARIAFDISKQIKELVRIIEGETPLNSANDLT